MNNPIPEKLRNKEFRFVLIDGHTKKPLELEWTTKNNYSYDDPKLINHIKAGNNYGVLGGYGNLVIFDIDDPKYFNKFKKILSKTFTVETGSGNLHFFVLADNTEKVVLEKNEEHIGEIQGKGSQCLCPGSIHPKTKKQYKIINNISIAKIDNKILGQIKKEFAKSETKKPNWGEVEFTPVGNQIPIKQFVDIKKLKKVRKGEYQGKHPFHESETGTNFDVNILKNLWKCWRHDSGGDTLGFIAMKEGICKCEDFKKDGKKLRGEDFKDTLEIAKQKYNVDIENSIQEEKNIIEKDILELFTDENGTAYASFKTLNHTENWPVNSRHFKNFITKKIFQKKGRPPTPNIINTLQNIYSAIAMFEGKKYKVYLRSALVDNVLYIDTGDDDWNVIKITTDEISIVKNINVKFKRFSHMKPLALDLNADLKDIDLIFNHIPIKNQGDKILFKPYLVVLFIEGIPTAILNVYGPQGSGKSMAQKFIRSLVDPSSLKIISLAKNLVELVQQVSHHFLPFFDNVTSINKSYSDFFCRAVTGEGFTKRELYTNDEDIIYNIKRKLAFNGINLPGEEPDFLDRSFTIHLSRINKRERRTEEDLWRQFEIDRPKITGALLKAVQLTLKKVKDIKINTLPRMADYAKWGEAAAQILGEKPDVFLRQYFLKIDKLNKEALEANPVGLCLMELMADYDVWAGTPTELLNALTPIAENLKVDRLSNWPKGAQVLTRRLNEVSSNLEDEGFKFETYHDGKQRKIKIIKDSVNTVNTVNEENLSNIKQDNSRDNITSKNNKEVLNDNTDKTVLTANNTASSGTVNSENQWRIVKNNKKDTKNMDLNSFNTNSSKNKNKLGENQK